MGGVVPPAGVALIGIGDELLAAGEARRARTRDPRLVRVLGKNGMARWCDLWELCPDIAPQDYRGPVQLITNGGKCRAYIDYDRSRRDRWAWLDYPPMPANMNVKPDERGRGKVIIEPNVKPVSCNKDWGWNNWLELVKDKSVPWAQVGPPGSKVLDGVRMIETKTPADALRVLASAKAAVLQEGFLHHAAAAVNLRAVVLFGAFITPKSTGYDSHINLWVDIPQAQGWRKPNRLCDRAWQTIKPEAVLCKLKTLLS